MYWICNIVYQIDTKRATKLNTIYEIYYIMHQRNNIDGYSIVIHTIYIEYIILCIKETMIMNIKNWNLIQNILNKWHCALKRQ